MFVATERGVTFGAGYSVSNTRPEFDQIMRALRTGNMELATHLTHDPICNIDGIVRTQAGLSYHEQKISPKVEDILLKYIVAFYKEKISYKYTLGNLTKYLVLANEITLGALMEEYFPITLQGMLVGINENNLVEINPADYPDKIIRILEYNVDINQPRSILYRQEFKLKGAL